MPTVTVEGEKSFEVESGKKLVLAIEDAGIDIMHRCGGNARCTTCRVQVLAGDASAMEATRAGAAGTRDEPRTQHSPVVPDSCRIGLVGRRRQSVQSDRDSRPELDRWIEPPPRRPHPWRLPVAKSRCSPLFECRRTRRST